MHEPGFCQYLEWDSRFFGLKVGRLTLSRLRPDVVPAVLDWCRANQIECLYFLADAEDSETARLAPEQGFRLVDVRVTLENGSFAGAAAPAPANAKGIRPFRASDLPVLRELAGRLHLDSRFFFDAHFPPARSRALFELWLEKSCQAADGKVFVAEWKSKPTGYVACRRVNGQTGRIDLLGVDTPAQGRGVGRGLVMTALGWFAAAGIARASVVTQGRNWRAQRLYQRCGFTTASRQLWYHCWFPSAADKRKA